MATIAGVVATTTVSAGADVWAHPDGGRALGERGQTGRGPTAEMLAAPVTVRGGGGPETTVSDAPPQFDRARLQRASRSRSASSVDLDPAPAVLPGTLDIGQRAALRRAGWAVPAKLASQWLLRDARVVSEADDARGTLQLVYTRGGARVSVFQRAAPLDWSGVPDDAASVPELAGSVREWPDADPARLVWQAGDRTFVVVGAVERDELVRIAKSLPEAETESVWRRLRRGLSELFARLVP